MAADLASPSQKSLQCRHGPYLRLQQNGRFLKITLIISSSPEGVASVEIMVPLVGFEKELSNQRMIIEVEHKKIEERLGR